MRLHSSPNQHYMVSLECYTSQPSPNIFHYLAS